MSENSSKNDTIEISDNETEENKESKSWNWSHFELTTVNKSQKLKCKNCSKIYSAKTGHNALKLHQK
jgi:hypothetical protein